MYYPYFRGRQAELLALKDLVTSGLLSEDVIPIVEPVKVSPTLKRTIDAFEVSLPARKLAVILNPEKGINEKQDSNIEWGSALQLDEKVRVIPAFLFTSRAEKIMTSFTGRPRLTSNSMIGFVGDNSLDYFESVQGEHLISVIHPTALAFSDGNSMIRRSVNRVLRDTGQSVKKIAFRDAFNKKRTNSGYLDTPDELFSDDHLYFLEDGYSGFGDYSIIGNAYDEGGFAPYAVAIHIVYFDGKNNLRIHHFVSDTNQDFRDTAGKFGEAVQKLSIWCNSHPELYRTKGLQVLLEHAERNTFPGLATVKRLSIMHHLELMGHFFDEEQEK